MTPASNTSPTPVAHTLRRRRGLTEEAAAAAVDQACRRLRLPTIRALVDQAVTAATKEQLTYHGFLAELLLAEVDNLYMGGPAGGGGVRGHITPSVTTQSLFLDRDAIRPKIEVFRA